MLFISVNFRLQHLGLPDAALWGSRKDTSSAMFHLRENHPLRKATFESDTGAYRWKLMEGCNFSPKSPTIQSYGERIIEAWEAYNISCSEVQQTWTKQQYISVNFWSPPFLMRMQVRIVVDYNYESVDTS